MGIFVVLKIFNFVKQFDIRSTANLRQKRNGVSARDPLDVGFLWIYLSQHQRRCRWNRYTGYHTEQTTWKASVDCAFNQQR